VFYSNFVPKTHRLWNIRLRICRDLENRDIRCRKYRDLEIWVRGHSRHW